MASLCCLHRVHRAPLAWLEHAFSHMPRVSLEGGSFRVEVSTETAMKARTVNSWVGGGHLLSCLGSQAVQVDGLCADGSIVDTLTPVPPQTCVQLLYGL